MTEISLLKYYHITLCSLLGVLAGLPCAAHAQWADAFDTNNPAWMTDRYAPAEFQSASFLGDNRLQVTIDQTGSALNRPSPTYSAAFFNTQGDQRAVGILGGWSLSADVFVSSAYDTTTGQLVEASLWAHTGTTPSTGTYASIGFTNASPTDPLNPNARDRAFSFQVFDGSAADPSSFFDIGLPSGFAFNTWNTLSITSTGTVFDFDLDGSTVFTDPTASGVDLQTAFIEAYNFGQTDSNGLNSYSVYWDNATASVIPEPTSFAFAAGLASLGLVWAHRYVRRTFSSTHPAQPQNPPPWQTRVRDNSTP